jgi:hypothetical protein
MSSVSISSTVAIGNGLLQLVMVVWVFFVYEVQDPRSVSHRLHVDVAFLVLLSVSLLVQALVKLLEAFQTQAHTLFFAVGLGLLVELGGWFVLISSYGDDTVHYAGVVLFLLGNTVLVLSLLVWHELEKKRACSRWTLSLLWGAYGVSLLLVMAFIICFLLESVRLEYYFEWLALAMYAGADLGYMLVFSYQLF